MTHQDECPVIDDLTALLIEHGAAAMASALATLMNHAMQIEREQVLKAESHRRTSDRQGYANGFKPKTLKTRVGQVALRIPQTRGYRDENGRPFYPRPIGEITYLILDARYEKVRHDGAIVPCALLTAIGIGPDGKRSILGCSVQLSEAETHWRSFLQSLIDRGMRGIKLVVSDDHAGLKAARQAVLAGVPWHAASFI